MHDNYQPTHHVHAGTHQLMPAVLGGLAGAVTVTLLNEGARRVAPHTPRMDVIGERALAKTLRAAHVQPPRGDALYRSTMAADLASNALYYALVALGPRDGALPRGAALGLAAGIGAVLLPGPLGLGRQPGARPPFTQLLTVTWYTAGGLAAASVYHALKSNQAGR